MSRVQGGWAKDSKQHDAKRSAPVSNYSVVYQENNSKPLIKPDDIFIKTAGETTLSTEPSGLSKYGYINFATNNPYSKFSTEADNGQTKWERRGMLRRIALYPDFLVNEDADRCFAALHDQLPWQQNRDKYGPQPRLTVWYGAHPYTYSGLQHQAHDSWHPLLLDIREKLEALTGRTFNSVLCNLYRDNHDSVDWHSDDEPSLKRNPYIASVSLGEVRLFEMRKKPPRELFGNFEYAQHVKMHLPHGSLIVMEGSTQDDWQHRVPKEYHDKGPRINLTFRTIYPE